MELTKKLNIPAAYLYSKIIDSVLYDINQATGKAANKKHLKDFEYVKAFSKNVHARIKIEEAQEDQVYRFRTSTTKNEFLAQYQIKSISDTACEVHYSETMKSFGFLQQMNDMFMGIAFGFFKKRRFKKMLEMIEKSYQ